MIPSKYQRESDLIANVIEFFRASAIMLPKALALVDRRLLYMALLLLLE